VGYNYSFQTTGTNVNINFELLDDKSGLVAYLWDYTSGFVEKAMTNVSGKKFTAMLTGQTIGSTIQIACKFAYAGGMSVTKTFSYVVGNACTQTGVENPSANAVFFYPNPVQNVLHLQLNAGSNRVVLMDMMGRKVFDKTVSDSYTIDMNTYETGIYFIRVENQQGVLNGKVIKK
jgi:hypothetical protein